MWQSFYWLKKEELQYINILLHVSKQQNNSFFIFLMLFTHMSIISVINNLFTRLRLLLSWKSIGHQQAFSIRLCPGKSFPVLCSCYSPFWCLLPIFRVVCSLAFFYCSSLEDSKLALALLCSLVSFKNQVFLYLTYFFPIAVYYRVQMDSFSNIDT